MGQRLIISENERAHISNMYGLINESIPVGLLNASSEKLSRAFTNILNKRMLPNLIRQINNKLNVSTTKGFGGETWTFSIQGMISSAVVTVTGLKAKDVSKGQIEIIVNSLLNPAVGTLDVKVDDESLMEDQKQPLNASGTRITVIFGTDFKMKANDATDIKGADNRKIWVKKVYVSLNSEPETLVIDGDELGTFQVVDNEITASLDYPTLGLEADLSQSMGEIIQGQVDNLVEKGLRDGTLVFTFEKDKADIGELINVVDKMGSEGSNSLSEQDSPDGQEKQENQKLPTIDDKVSNKGFIGFIKKLVGQKKAPENVSTPEDFFKFMKGDNKKGSGQMNESRNILNEGVISKLVNSQKDKILRLINNKIETELPIQQSISKNQCWTISWPMPGVLGMTWYYHQDICLGTFYVTVNINEIRLQNLQVSETDGNLRFSVSGYITGKADFSGTRFDYDRRTTTMWGIVGLNISIPGDKINSQNDITASDINISADVDISSDTIDLNLVWARVWHNDVNLWNKFFDKNVTNIGRQVESEIERADQIKEPIVDALNEAKKQLKSQK